MERSAKGSQISVKLAENSRSFNGKKIMHGVVTRNRLDIDNIVERICERSPGMSAASMRAVIELFCDEIGYSLEEGDAVVLPGVGLLRLGLKGYVPYSEHPHASDIKGFKVKFTPDKGLTKRVNNINTDRVVVTTGCPVVNTAYDMGTKDTRVWNVTHLVTVRGKDIKPLNDPSAGIYLAPVLADKTIPKDISLWYKIEGGNIITSTNTTLTFILPLDVPHISSGVSSGVTSGVSSGREYKLVLRRGGVKKSGTTVLLQTEVDWPVRVVGGD